MSTNIKKLLASLLAIVLVFSLMPNMVLVTNAAEAQEAPANAAVIDNGKPVSVWDGKTVDMEWYNSDPSAKEYTLTTAAQLVGLATLTNSTYKKTFEGQKIILGANIVINEGDASTWSLDVAPANKSWAPIGASVRFKGHFDGQGCYISGIYSKRTDNNGVFQNTESCTIENLAVINSYFVNTGNTSASPSGQMLSSIVARLYTSGTLRNLYSNAYIVQAHKDWCTGGIVAMAQNTKTTQKIVVEGCVFDGTIAKATSQTGSYVGGILGATDSKDGTVEVNNCLMTGSISTNASGVGGILGQMTGSGTKVTNCVVASTKNTVSSTGSNFGAIVGQMGANNKNWTNMAVENCFYSAAFAKAIGTQLGTINGAAGSEYKAACTPMAAVSGSDQGAFPAEWFEGEAPAWTMTEACPVPAYIASFYPEFHHNHVYADNMDMICNVCEYSRGDMSWYQNDDGDGVYEIDSADDLYGFAYLVNHGLESFKGKKVVLTADIVVNEGRAEDWAAGKKPEREWISIGAYSWTAGQFQGIFDGQNHFISGLYQVLDNSWGGGLFNSAVNATIQNLALVNSYFKNTNTTNTGGHMGSICTRSQDTSFLNLYSDAIMYSEYALKVGGITGVLVTVDDPILVENCVFTGSITTGKTDKNRVAGIVGSVDVDGTAENHVTIKNCLNLGDVIGGREVGGIVGNFKNYAVVENCVNAGKVTCRISGFGGIVGWHNSKNLTLKNCHYVEGTSTVAMSGSTSSTFIENTNNTMVSLSDIKGAISSELGLADWTAYECDYPVPTGVKAIYEKHVTPDTEHDETGAAADCGNPKVCPDCGEVLDPATGEHEDSDDEDFKCDVCGQDVVHTDDNLKFDKKGISFQSYIGLQPTILKSLVEGFDKVYVMANGEKIEGFLYQESVYVFDKMILSTEMTKKVTFTIYGEKDGKLYRGEEFTTSLAELALTKIEAFDAAGEANLCTILVDMLNYGAEAQKIYTPDATVLANANLGDYAKYASTSELNLSKENSTDGEGEVLVNEFKLSLQSVLEINLTFAKDMTDYLAMVTVNGVTKEYGFEALGENSYVLRIPVGAMLVHEDVVVEVYDPTGALVTPTYTCSVESIAKERIAAEVAVDLVTAMMHYCDAVINVFGK